MTLKINLHRVSVYIFKMEHNVVGSNDESLSGKTGLSLMKLASLGTQIYKPWNLTSISMA